jgi:hypothetical protein
VKSTRQTQLSFVLRGTAWFARPSRAQLTNSLVFQPVQGGWFSSVAVRLMRRVP